MRTRFIFSGVAFFIIAFSALPSSGASKEAYTLYARDGAPSSYDAMFDRARRADVIVFGELHENPISHWIEYELVRGLHAEMKGNLVLGAEMFEADTQIIINEFLEKIIPAHRFERESRAWPNYDTDYRRLVEFARDNNIPFIATNIPRRYASLVFSKGPAALASLSPEAKRYIVPLPFTFDPSLKSYSDLSARLPFRGDDAIHAAGHLVEAQAVRDATMAHFILAALSPGKKFFHINGAYHSDFDGGIVHFLRQKKEGLGIVTISTVVQDAIGSLEASHRGRADFILCTPSSMAPPR